MSKIDLFDLNEPKDLYKIIHEVYREYINHPTERNFLFLILGFTHLCEWISKSKYEDIKKKKNRGDSLTDGELFSLEIHLMHSFDIVRNLCNRGKHYITRSTSPETSKVEGLNVGFGKVGDSIDQLYFLIDGRDSREYFIDLINKYNDWFSKQS